MGKITEKDPNNLKMLVSLGVFILFIILLLVLCKNRGDEEKFRHFVLADNAYANTLLPTYSRKGGWPISLPKNKESYNSFTKNLKDHMLQMDVECSSVADCVEGQLCVEPSYYGGGQHGYCMYSNEPGIPRDLLSSVRDNGKENFYHLQQRPCPVTNFFNEPADQCQPIFQGPSTAEAINSIKPRYPPDIFLPGTTFPEYGTGTTDPVDVPFQDLGMGVAKLIADN